MPAVNGDGTPAEIIAVNHTKLKEYLDPDVTDKHHGRFGQFNDLVLNYVRLYLDGETLSKPAKDFLFETGVFYVPTIVKLGPVDQKD